MCEHEWDGCRHYLRWWTDCRTARTLVHDGRMSWRRWGNGWSCCSCCWQKRASAAPAVPRTPGWTLPCLGRGSCWLLLGTFPVLDRAAGTVGALRWRQPVCSGERGAGGWENENKWWTWGELWMHNNKSEWKCQKQTKSEWLQDTDALLCVVGVSTRVKGTS